MIVKARLSRLRRTKGWEYALRFAFGGVVTVATGLVAKEFGPVVGGLFLAFPGIFPAGVTLVERHEREKKRRLDLPGTRRGRRVAGIVSAGAVPGAIGLLAFALVAWALLPRVPGAWALASATGAWIAVSIVAWALRFRVRRQRSVRNVTE